MDMAAGARGTGVQAWGGGGGHDRDRNWGAWAHGFRGVALPRTHALGGDEDPDTREFKLGTVTPWRLVLRHKRGNRSNWLVVVTVGGWQWRRSGRMRCSSGTSLSPSLGRSFFLDATEP